jgi:hypothetical protein
MWLVTCCKSGRFLRVASEGQARNAARSMGWTDYTMERET